jgi:hypothetical protein
MALSPEMTQVHSLKMALRAEKKYVSSHSSLLLTHLVILGYWHWTKSAWIRSKRLA